MTKSHQLWDLSLFSKSTLKSFTMIHIANSHSIARACQLLGNTFGKGSRNHPPKKDDPPKVLEVGNVCNIVSVGEEPDVSLLQFKELILFMMSKINHSQCVSSIEGCQQKTLLLVAHLDLWYLDKDHWTPVQAKAHSHSCDCNRYNIWERRRAIKSSKGGWG